jgi:hypothetical protein
MKEIIKEVESKYSLSITEIDPINRKDMGNDNLLLRLDTIRHPFFFKEIPSHSMHEGLDLIYSELSTIRPKLFKMVLPLKSTNGLYCEKILEMNAMVYPFIKHQVLQETRVPIDTIVSALREFHELTSPLNIPPHPFKTYANWFERGIVQMRKRIGHHDFLDSIELFFNDRFKKINFKMGNAHFDLNPFNLWTDNSNELLFSDFDNCQPGALAKDFYDVMAAYWNVTEEGITISSEDLKKIKHHSEYFISGLEKNDVFFLLSRPKLGPLFNPENGMDEVRIRRHLDQIKNFLE